jgi:hypothetical protein
MAKRIRRALAAAALTALALTGCGTAVHPVSPPAASAPAVAQSSAPATSGPVMMTPGQSETVGMGNTPVGTVTVESITATTEPADPSFGQAPANGYYVIVRVKDTADPSYTGGWDVNELDFYALAGGSHYDPGDGNAYEALSDSQSNADITSTLAAGETAKGWLAFDVPSRHGRIVYAPNLNGQPLAEWSY